MKRSVIFLFLVSCIFEISAHGICFRVGKTINRYKYPIAGRMFHNITKINRMNRTFSAVPRTISTTRTSGVTNDTSIEVLTSDTCVSRDSASQQKHGTAKETMTMETILLVISGLFSLCLLCLIFSSLRDRPKETQNHYPLPAGCIFLANGGGIMIRKRFF